MTVEIGSSDSQEKRELPYGWCWAKLEEVCKVISKGTTPSSLGLSYSNEGVPFLRAEDINGSVVDPSKVVFHVSSQTNDVLDRSRLFSGDFLITIAGTLGRVGYIAEGMPSMNCNQAVAFARPRRELVSVEFMVYICQNQDVIAPLLNQRAGGALQNLNLQQIRSLRIPLPPLPEQQRIAALLKEQMAAVDKARAAAEKRLAAIKALPSAFLRQVFPEPGQPLPDGWRWLKLGDVCQQDRQIVEPNTLEAETLTYYSLEHIESETGRILKSPASQVEDEGKSMTFRFDEQHVLYGKLRPYLNKVALPLNAGRCTTELIPLLPAGNTDRFFLAWLLRRHETVAFAMSGKTGSRMPRADMVRFLAFKVPLPPLPEQQRIAALLKEQMTAVEKARIATEAELETINALPASLIRRAFNGEL